MRLNGTYDTNKICGVRLTKSLSHLKLRCNVYARRVSSDDYYCATNTLTHSHTAHFKLIVYFLFHFATLYEVRICGRHTWRSNVHNHYYSWPVHRKYTHNTHSNGDRGERGRISVMFQFKTINCFVECANTVEIEPNKMTMRLMLLLMIQRDLSI